MNTMADGAAQRLVAQIGEALFGQPGLTLNEIANQCMAERSRSDFEPILHTSIFDACTEERNLLRAEMDQVAGCLPGVYYMDPPDGGNVSIPEQVRRMAEDAAHYRKATQLAGQIVAWHWPSTGAVCSAEAVERDRACTDNAVPLYAAPPAQAVDLGPGVQGIAIERQRQMAAERFTTAHDEQYQRGELAKAAVAYAQLAAMELDAGTRGHIGWLNPPAIWPWEAHWWKPVDARRDLVRAGALIAAQIDLIDSKAVGK